MEYEPVIGLEIHAELKTQTKMFCDCKNDPDEKHPNINVCPVCLAHPGTLPVPNKDAIEKVILVGMALHAEIPERSHFDRKNYFYPDLPRGYQISQYEDPLVKGGYLEFAISSGSIRHIRITRVHLEEDTGRLSHDSKSQSSAVDFNRAGVPLMELVTEPDIRSAEEARCFGEELQLVLRYTGASDADMEKGQMRVEANVSVRPKGMKEFGTKVEVKNINSFKFAEKAIEYEIKRQTGVLEKGEKVIQETRGWDETKGVTFSQRAKEGATDYRYFPEPDIPPLVLDQAWLQSIRAKLTELPGAKRKRFAGEYKLDEKTIELFINDRELAEYFEKVVSEMAEWISSMGDRVERDKVIKLASNYLTSDFQKLRNETESAVSDTLITPENFAELAALVYEDKISSAAAKKVLEIMFRKGGDPSEIIRDKNLGQESSGEMLGKIAKQVIAENPAIAAEIKNGKTNAIQALVGAAMKLSQGKANPAMLRTLIEKELREA
ncbi:MAG: Aspartyl/glutamyl-tRNA(Asn/Gln) amidotransferase subunit B [Parcubacteria group bacterium GW2011_GWB1_52_7]|nr:MAG: Aspartyl/glutamyl-tRNA(Asn/Gln) amidotransferase subunit B [Parcubacteria group bacterium GW2011_GWA1_51_12]KKW28331.1 MAG: Aspartyl/glutamyl-tRNA(Asn/Gln) amidotransferase subunit B [Parcubacteria group bacterium GW2011_GWB1_52_7]KKW30198.1 MAG: Aspartyl/glutamyl-tRNA(Asn/Gln) amidotransferase subunit B [Parcubacteria group bacterium GW2011_GWC2_52_8c]